MRVRPGPHARLSSGPTSLAAASACASCSGDALQPIFTPPWNRCTADTGSALAALGFRALSREHRAEPLAVPGLFELPVHVDWVRLEPAELAARMATQITAGGPLGVMLHHAVMEPETMDRTSELLALVAAHEQARARPMLELLA